MENPFDNFNFDVRYYIALLRNRIGLLVTAAIVGAVVMAFVTFILLDPIYKASTTLLVDAGVSTNEADINTIRASESLVGTYSEWIVSRPVLEKARNELLAPRTYTQLRNQVAAVPVANTQFIRIEVQDTNPQLATDLANTIADVFIGENQAYRTAGLQASKDRLLTQITALEEQIDDTRAAMDAAGSDRTERARLEGILAQYNQTYTSLLQSFEELSLAEVEATSNVLRIDVATVPTAPVSPNIPLNIVLGGFFGLFLTSALIIVRDFADDTVKNPNEVVRILRTSILGEIWRFNSEDNPIVVASHPRSPAAEAFRTLRLNIKYASVAAGKDRAFKRILVTSPTPGDGKSTVASNLSYAMVHGGQNTVLVDGDMRRPNVHLNLDLPNRKGLSDIFIEPLDRVDQFIQESSMPGLYAVTSGALPPNPSELLDSRKGEDILSHLAERFDQVIIDAPPVLSLPDAMALSQHVDGVILVLRANHTKLTAARQALERLQKVKAPVIGLAITDIDINSSTYGGYYMRNYYTEMYFDREEWHMASNGWRAPWRRKKQTPQASA